LSTGYGYIDSSSQNAEVIEEVAGNSESIKLTFKIIYVKRSEKGASLPTD
jgi:hypothetical protein